MGSNGIGKGTRINKCSELIFAKGKEDPEKKEGKREGI